MKKKFMSKIFVTLLISYILIMLFPIINNLITSYIFSSSMDTVIEDGKQTTLMQAASFLDHEFDKADRIYKNIISNSQLQEIIYKYEDLNNYNTFQVKEIISNHYNLKSDFIKETLLFLPLNKTLISSTNVVTSDIVSKKLYNIEINLFKELDISYASFSIIVDSVFTLPNNSQKLMLIARKLPITSSDKINPIIIFAVSEDEIISTMNSFFPSKYDSWYIGDKTNKVLSSEGDLVSMKNCNLKTSGNSISKQSFMSKSMPISYNLVYNNNFFSSKSYKSMKYIIIVSVIFTTLGIVLAFYYSYKNYKPIHAISLKLNEFKHDIPAEKNLNNEYELIESAVTSAANQINHMKPFFINSLLKKLLISNEVTNIEALLKNYDINFSSNLFRVAIFSFQSFHSDDQYLKLDEFISKLHLSINNEFSDFANVYFVSLDNMHQILIFNIHSNVSDRTTQCLNKIKNMYQGISTIDFTCGISNLICSTSNIKIGYINAQTALEYCINKNDMIFFDNIVESQTIYNYSSDTAKQFVNILKSGNINHVENIIDQIIEQNMVDNNIRVSSIRCLYVNMINDICSVYKELAIQNSSVFIMLDPIKHMNKILTIQQFKNDVLVPCQDICQKIIENALSPNKIIVQKAQKFIANNYQNQNLSVSYIAETLHITASYLSSVFKEQAGLNLSDYIHKIRIEHSLELLSQAGITISTMAEECGYSNDLTLTRAFKKITGITPGSYRKQLNLKNDNLLK